MVNQVRRRILVIADDPPFAAALSAALPADRCDVVHAPSWSAARALLDGDHFDAALIDLGLSEVDGFEALEALRRARPALPVVAMSDATDMTDALRALHLGAVDYLSRETPLEDIETAVGRLLKTELSTVIRPVPAIAPPSVTPAGLLVGGSPVMVAIYKLIARAANVDSSVLITGETGTGKEIVARAIHEASARHGAPYLAVDCASLPGELFESELFGHERGAFTGAYALRRGILETVENGTCFLDEVGELPVGQQAKLLRALQERTIRRVGGRDALPIRARILAATNRNLADLVQQGLFREDLFYRLNVIAIHLPPLRERRGDIPFLVQSFAARFAERAGRPAPVISLEAQHRLEAYDWPGNVRQLENVLERTMAVTPYSVILAEDLPAEIAACADPPGGATRHGDVMGSELISLKSLTVQHVHEVLARTGGNKVHAARMLGIDRRTLYRILNRFSNGAAAQAS